MRMPWAKSKGEQLDLLGSEPVVGVHAKPATPRPPAQAGQPLFVATSALHEDLSKPRTELPEDELPELTEDIRQRGILQPIVAHPVDGDGRYRIHFGARRWRAAQLAGLDQVPVVVRDAPADPYAQVAENQKRHGLTPLDLARFIRARIDVGESNSEVARRLGMNLTTVAHHLALLELPPVLDEALKSGRCTSPRTLHALSKLHDEDPVQVANLLSSGVEITRAKVTALRAAPPTPSVKEASGQRRPSSSPEPSSRATDSSRRLGASTRRISAPLRTLNSTPCLLGSKASPSVGARGLTVRPCRRPNAEPMVSGVWDEKSWMVG
jgi:ParB family transcriptional regulator, chromosome partitioning protein